MRSAPLFTVANPGWKKIAVGPALVKATTLNTTENNIPCPLTVSTLDNASSAELLKLVVSLAKTKLLCPWKTDATPSPLVAVKLSRCAAKYVGS